MITENSELRLGIFNEFVELYLLLKANSESEDIQEKFITFEDSSAMNKVKDFAKENNVVVCDESENDYQDSTDILKEMKSKTESLVKELGL